MKLLCPCGATIHDGTDFKLDKARFIADQDWFDAVDVPAGLSAAQVQETVGDQLRDVGRSMWQCAQCGRLAVDDHDYVVRWFEPVDEATPRALLGSVHRDRWRRPMAGSWRSRAGNPANGELWWGPGGSDGDDDEGFETFDTWEDLERRYHEVFTRLRDRGVLRSAFLRRDGLTVHHWPEPTDTA